MKKKYIKLIIYVVIIAVLAGVYFFLSSGENNSNEVESGDADQNLVKLTDGEAQDVSSIILKGENGVTEIVLKDGKWVIKGFEDIELSSSNIEGFVSSMSSLSANEVLNSAPNLAEYGLDKTDKSLTVVYNDNRQEVVFLGTVTADNSYYYAKKADSDKVYMIDSLNGKRIGYTINDFADKSIDKVSPYKIMALNIKQEGKPEIDLEYTQDKEGNAQELMSMGMETMKMNKPYPNMAVYPSNLQESVLSTLADIQIGDIAKPSLEGLAEFGLEAPKAQIYVSDGDNSLKIAVGEKADDKSYYCIVNDKKLVFLIDEKYITPFLNADPIKFMEKFVALHYRVDLEKVSLMLGEKNFDITFGEEEKTENENTEQKTRFNDNRKTYLNGKEIDKDTFGDLFELIAGVTFDSINEEEGGKFALKSNAPLAEIKYTLKDGTINDVRFMEFNDSFYIVNTEKINGMIVSKQNVSRIFSKIDEILKK